MSKGAKYFALGVALGFAVILANTLGFLAPLKRPGYEGTGD